MAANADATITEPVLRATDVMMIRLLPLLPMNQPDLLIGGPD
jgi:hypothetical protein